jgi:glycosyltransferase involved in cell wall biosynthesis
MSPAISVVIPIYNQEKYLGKCIRSVLNQTFQDFEVILVNDGSTDNSLKICQKYAKRDGRVSIVEKQNEGLAQVRKDGILKACGEYVCFLDSDDYLALDTLELLFGIANEKGVDMVVGNYDRVCDNWGVVKKKSGFYPRHLTDRLITKTEIMPLFLGLEYLSANADHVWGVYVWGRLYRRSCIQNALSMDMDLLFPSIKDFKSEDDSFNIAIAPFLTAIWITNTIVCHYRKGGVTNGDMPYIRRGGYLYDERYDRCFQYGCEHVLPMIFGRYVNQLQRDVINQIHFGMSSEDQLHEFVQKEVNERKIVLWARQNKIDFPKNEKEKNLQQAILVGDVQKIIDCAYEREGYLQHVHYPKMKLVRIYQNIVDQIGMCL